MTSSTHLDEATALKDFLYTKEGQKIWAQPASCGSIPSVAQDFADRFPDAEEPWTIADLGGWNSVYPALFDKENGSHHETL